MAAPGSARLQLIQDAWAKAAGPRTQKAGGCPGTAVAPEADAGPVPWLQIRLKPPSLSWAVEGKTQLFQGKRGSASLWGPESSCDSPGVQGGLCLWISERAVGPGRVGSTGLPCLSHAGDIVGTGFLLGIWGIWRSIEGALSTVGPGPRSQAPSREVQMVRNLATLTLLNYGGKKW